MREFLSKPSDQQSVALTGQDYSVVAVVVVVAVAVVAAAAATAAAAGAGDIITVIIPRCPKLVTSGL